MHISKVEIYNFRAHKETIVNLSDVNILIGINNSGKTSFLDAINLAIGYPFKTRVITEEDFHADTPSFSPGDCKPIKIVLEFREGYNENKRFSENIVNDFDGIIQDDNTVVPEGEEPIKFIRLAFEAFYNKDKAKVESKRYFLRSNGSIIDEKTLLPRKHHYSYFPALYLQTLRDIGSELKRKSSFLGKIKNSIDYSDKQEALSTLFEQLEALLFDGNETFSQLKSKVEELRKSIRFSNKSEINFQAFEKENWRLLNNLSIHLNSSNNNLNLPIDKHGMGVQNVTILLILEAYLEIILPEELENEEATPILCIEEPEAHLHPNAQRAILNQIVNMQGQKIISTHSPYIVDKADISNFIIFKLEDGVTKTYQLPEYVENYSFKYGLPEKAYSSTKFLKPEDIVDIERYIKYQNPELLFSELIILCEGDSEKIVMEILAERVLGKQIAELGISIIACDGQTYSPFLKVAKGFNIKSFILSDSEADTLKRLRDTINRIGFNSDYFDKNVFKYDDNNDFESTIIRYYGSGKLKEFLSSRYKDSDFRKLKSNVRYPLTYNNTEITSIENWKDELFINYFIDKKGKPFCAYLIANGIVNSGDNILPEIENLLKTVERELS